jgi:hypothetical protein
VVDRDYAGVKLFQVFEEPCHLLADHPEAAGELQALLAEFKAMIPETGGNVTNTISGTVLGGPVLMGRDFLFVTTRSTTGH